jgi:hypothetical protein
MNRSRGNGEPCAELRHKRIQTIHPDGHDLAVALLVDSVLSGSAATEASGLNQAA